MFDMVYTGSRLAEARRAKNMTQMELADRLGISFQAVSNWERGISMPDISKLPELSELLGVSVDELLGKSSPLIGSAIGGNVKEYASGGEISIDEVVEAAPLLKPSQTDAIVCELSKHRRLSDLEELFPFLGRDMCDELFKRALGEKDYGGVEEIAPFVSRSLINETLLENAASGLPIGELAPFADTAVVDEAALKLADRKEICGRLDDLMPFISKAVLERIADAEYALNGLRNFENFAPFLSGEKLRGLAEEAIEKDGIRAISPIAPFLDRNFLVKYVREQYL